MTRTVALDFDGVIHRYSRGWADGTIYDEPMPGAIEGIKKLQERYAVYVLTSRWPGDVCRWLRDHGVASEWSPPSGGGPAFWDRQDLVYVTNVKLPAIAYVDDRAVVFASWGQIGDQLAGAESGNFGPACCGSHGRSCEPGEYCCNRCSEADHGFLHPQHGTGWALCSNPDLSGAYGSAQVGKPTNPHQPAGSREQCGGSGEPAVEAPPKRES